MYSKPILTLSLLASAVAVQAAQRPNVILIMADDMGCNDISCYTSTNIKTPNVDRLASQGVRFTDYHSNGSSSSPTRAALVTGRYQQRCGINAVINAATMRHIGLALDEFTIAEAFKENGYKTAMFGKWHLGYELKYNPTNQGFDTFEGYISGNVDYHTHIDQAGNPDWWKEKLQFIEEGYTTDLITQKSVNYINNHKKGDKPFFLYIPHEASHYPIQGRKSAPTRHHADGAKGLVPKSEQVQLSHEEGYKEMVEVMDEGIGKVIDAIIANKLDKNTVIFFCTDNGSPRESSNAPFRGRKGQVFEGGHRVPGVMWAPGYKIAPKIPYVYNETIMGIDLFPTLLNFAGGTPPKNLDGVDFLPSLKKGKPLPQRNTFYKDLKSVSIRKGSYKLITFNAKPDSPALYDLSKDIAETTDIAAKHPELVSQMKAEVREWCIEVGEPLGVKLAPKTDGSKTKTKAKAKKKPKAKK